MMETQTHHRQHRLEVSNIIMLLVIASGIHLVFNLFKKTTDTFSFFVFNDIKLTVQMYVWFISNNIGECILYYVIWKITGSEILKIFFILQCIVFMDFILSYNTPLFSIGNAHYGFIQLTLIFKIGIVTIYLWKLS